MQLPVYVGLLHAAEGTLAESFRRIGEAHSAEADVYHICNQLAGECDAHVEAIQPIVDRVGEERQTEPERLHAEGLGGARSGPIGLLRDLHDLYLLASFVDLTWTLLGQAGQGARDHELLAVVDRCEQQTAT